MRTIEIDFDIHKLIEAERRNFDEPPNAALRRLLKLADTKKSPGPMARASSNSERAWQGEGVVLPHGTKVRMVYGRPKKTYLGAIFDGDWIIDGRKFDSPSGAASGVAVTGKGKKTRLNGWGLWEVQPPGEQGWISIGLLRKEAAPGRKREAEQFLKTLGL